MIIHINQLIEMLNKASSVSSDARQRLLAAIKTGATEKKQFVIQSTKFANYNLNALDEGVNVVHLSPEDLDALVPPREETPARTALREQHGFPPPLTSHPTTVIVQPDSAEAPAQ